MEFIQKNIFLVLIAVVSGTMLLWPVLRRSAGGPAVSTLQATQLINREDALVLDVRPEAEYSKGHILGARNVPLADLAARAGELERYKDKPVVVCCNTGNTSVGGVSQLRKAGFAKAVNLAGGLAAWQQAGLPVAKK